MRKTKNRSQVLSCPFCKSQGECEHLMLIFDKDAVAIEGGFLYEEANGRLETLKNMRLDEEGSDYLYGDLEEQFLNEIETLSDKQNSTGYNFGPGGRGEIVYYYCEDPNFVKSRYF